MNHAIAAALLQVNVDIGFDPAVNLVGSAVESFLTTLIVGFAVGAAGFGAVLDGWL
jgi:hypothetical protein